MSSKAWKVLANIINAAEDFLVVTHLKHNRLFIVKAGIGLLEYSFITNSWRKYDILVPSPHSFNCWSYNATAINNECNKVYLYNDVSSMTSLEILNDNKLTLKKIKHLDAIGYRAGAKGIMINDEFHIIGGYKWNHVKYNINTQKCDIVHDLSELFDSRQSICAGFCRNKQKLLTFGGYSNGKHIDTIYEYDILQNEWRAISAKLPKALATPACTSISNGDYVALFGGGNKNGNYDDIYLYSVQDQKFKVSKTKCPSKGRYQAITVNDRQKDKLLTFAFVRSRWKLCVIDDHLFPPEYLIRIICNYYINEWIHLFKNATGEHYKIDVFDILKLD